MPQFVGLDTQNNIGTSLLRIGEGRACWIWYTLTSHTKLLYIHGKLSTFCMKDQETLRERINIQPLGVRGCVRRGNVG